MWPCKSKTNEGSTSWLKYAWKNQIIILLHTCCLYCSIASSKAAKKSVFSPSNRWICAWRWTILSSFSPSFSLSCLWLQLPAVASASCVIFLQHFHRNKKFWQPKILDIWLIYFWARERLTWFLTEGLPLLNASLSSMELFSMPLSGPEAVVSALRSSSTEHSHSFARRFCSAVRVPSLSSSRSSLWYIGGIFLYRKWWLKKKKN